MPNPPLETPTLLTERLRLRPVSHDDEPALMRVRTDPYTMRYWDAPPWTDSAQATRFVENSHLEAEEGTGVRFTIERREDAAFVGSMSLTRWQPQHASAAIGYCLARDTWGRGYATEAGRVLLRWGFDTLPGLNRVQAETDTRNLASARVLEKLGFTREGTLREDCIVDGVVSNSHVFGLLRREWVGG